MPNKYETKTNPQLIKILRSRSLSLKGTKSERVQRLLDADEAHAARTNQLDLGPSLPLQNDGRPTVPNLPDLFSLSPHLYLLYDSNLRMSGTMIRLQKTLPKKGISASLQNIRSSWWFALLWEKIAHGRKLPALVQRGRVVGDFPQIEEWIASGDPKRHVDQACRNLEVDYEEEDYELLPGRLEDLDVPELGPNYFRYVLTSCPQP